MMDTTKVVPNILGSLKNIQKDKGHNNIPFEERHRIFKEDDEDIKKVKSKKSIYDEPSELDNVYYK